MPILLLPDLFAIVLMTVALAEVSRRFKDEQAKLWTGGLALIVLETVAHLLYAMRLPPVWHHFVHAVALDAFLLAGSLFLRSAVNSLLRMPRAWLYFSANLVAPFLLMSLYGMGWQLGALPRAIAICGTVVALGSTYLLRRPRYEAVALALLYTPVLLAPHPLLARQAVYLLLAELYLLTAIVFTAKIQKGSHAQPLVAFGFILWAVSFGTHPWVAQWGATVQELASHVWDMHKFAITMGFVLMLFERQVHNNQWLALHDELTGLPNRRLYEDRLAGAIARAERHGTSILVFNMDLNGLKNVNDQLGHDAGDAMLRQVVANMQRVIRSTDTLARLGGDEFTLLAVDISPPQAGNAARRRRTSPSKEFRLADLELPEAAGAAPGSVTAKHLSTEMPAPFVSNPPVRGSAAAIREALLLSAQRIERDLRAAVQEPIYVDGPQGRQELRMTTSLGFAMYPADTADVVELTRLADQRMYADKHGRGGGRPHATSHRPALTGATTASATAASVATLVAAAAAPETAQNKPISWVRS